MVIDESFIRFKVHYIELNNVYNVMMGKEERHEKTKKSQNIGWSQFERDSPI